MANSEIAKEYTDLELAAIERRKIKSSNPKTLISRETCSSCHVLPTREVMLEHLPKRARVAEVGVAFGDFTEEIIKTSQPKTLYLIDAWATERYQEGLRSIKTKFGPQIDEGNIIIMQGLSTDELPKLEPNSLDWAYIDTNHTFPTTYEELVLCDRLVTSTGFICGHDFCTGNIVGGVVYGVVEAVNKFCMEYGWQYRYLTLESHGHFSFGLSRMP